MSSCRTTGPSPSRNNGGESIRDSGNVSSTPKLRSRTQIVTPATTTNEQTTSSTKGTGYVEPEVCADADINNKNNSTQPPSKRRRVQTKQNDAVMEDSWQLPPPPPIIFDEGGHFTKDAMEVIRTQLSSSYKSNDNPPNEDDMRVAGMLMLWIFKYSNNDSKVSLAKLSSFPTYRQFTVAKVPTTYDTEVTARQTRERTKKASDWIDALMEGNFDTADVLVSLLDKNSKKKLPLKYIIKEWNANYRFDVDTTLAALKFSGINPTQAEKLMQFTDVETRQDGCLSGIRWLAPVKQIYQRKKEIVAKSFVSRRHKKVSLSSWVTKDKKKQAERLIQCSVASVRLEEVWLPPIPTVVRI